MKPRKIFVALLAGLLVGSFSTLTACAHHRAAEASNEARPAKASRREMAPPSGSSLAKVQRGMSAEQVREILGEPTSTNAYMTGKAFIPFYYGTDTARTDWKYKGLGRVVFSRNQYTGSLKVIRVDYNPNESGR